MRLIGVISLPSSHSVSGLAKLLPRCGVAIITTRRIEGLGWKKNVSCNFFFAFGSALICWNDSLLTSRQ